MFKSSKSRGLLTAVAASALMVLPAQARDIVKLQFSNGRSEVVGVENVNAVLRGAGVRASTVAIPEGAKPILRASETRAVSEAEQKKLITLFYLNRTQLLEQIELAGRTPEAHRGGYLSSAEPGVSPYPKVYDMKAMTAQQQSDVLRRFGRLHVNIADDGVAMDEVMTVVAGGPFTWMFVLPDGVVTRLTVDRVGPNDPALRLSYPGLGMHAGYMDPPDGLVIAFGHGPKEFIMRYQDDSVPHADLLNTNPWVDFSGSRPRLVERVR
ncbi:hypothetical protein [Novosphingobium sp. TCA1]|uniref:hypothetical protein n=1 Tax=Novosphingobium sp. TCA1 TaxID=2682474 RepID=UPI001306F94A|nr:hypothetical protein [Novosphingobium sp. TCA1]GFE77294.1 hypothetical protein NTCA1_49430 [Novosphingobium sp. TCA1]